MRVNRLLSSTALTTSAVFASGSALAQSATYSWTGWYVGFNVGWASADIGHDVSIPGYFDVASRGRDDVITGGAQVGYNWLFAPRWLVGVEADINYIGATRSNSFGATVTAGGGLEDVVGTQRSRVRWLSTVRARFGHTWSNSFLYVTGGLAIGGISSSVIAGAVENDAGGDASQFNGSNSATRVGWAAGVGLEHAFTNRLSVRLEYLHFDLGDVSYNVNGINTVGGGNGLPLLWPANARFDGDIVRFGINYKLWQ